MMDGSFLAAPSFHIRLPVGDTMTTFNFYVANTYTLCKYSKFTHDVQIHPTRIEFIAMEHNNLAYERLGHLK